MAYVNVRICKAAPESPLYKLPLIEEPSERLIEVHLACLRWNRQFGLTAAGCDKLQALSIEVLELLKSNMPDKTG